MATSSERIKKIARTAGKGTAGIAKILTEDIVEEVMKEQGISRRSSRTNNRRGTITSSKNAFQQTALRNITIAIANNGARLDVITSYLKNINYLTQSVDNELSSFKNDSLNFLSSSANSLKRIENQNLKSFAVLEDIESNLYHSLEKISDFVNNINITQRLPEKNIPSSEEKVKKSSKKESKDLDLLKDIVTSSKKLDSSVLKLSQELNTYFEKIFSNNKITNEKLKNIGDRISAGTGNVTKTKKALLDSLDVIKNSNNEDSNNVLTKLTNIGEKISAGTGNVTNTKKALLDSLEGISSQTFDVFNAIEISRDQIVNSLDVLKNSNTKNTNNVIDGLTSIGDKISDGTGNVTEVKKALLDSLERISSQTFDVFNAIEVSRKALLDSLDTLKNSNTENTNNVIDGLKNIGDKISDGTGNVTEVKKALLDSLDVLKNSNTEDSNNVIDGLKNIGNKISAGTGNVTETRKSLLDSLEGISSQTFDVFNAIEVSRDEIVKSLEKNPSLSDISREFSENSLFKEKLKFLKDIKNSLDLQSKELKEILISNDTNIKNNGKSIESSSKKINTTLKKNADQIEKLTSSNKDFLISLESNKENISNLTSSISRMKESIDAMNLNIGNNILQFSDNITSALETSNQQIKSLNVSSKNIVDSTKNNKDSIEKLSSSIEVIGNSLDVLELIQEEISSVYDALSIINSDVDSNKKAINDQSSLLISSFDKVQNSILENSKNIVFLKEEMLSTVQKTNEQINALTAANKDISNNVKENATNVNFLNNSLEEIGKILKSENNRITSNTRSLNTFIKTITPILNKTSDNIRLLITSSQNIVDGFKESKNSIDAVNKNINALNESFVSVKEIVSNFSENITSMNDNINKKIDRNAFDLSGMIGKVSVLTNNNLTELIKNSENNNNSIEQLTSIVNTMPETINTMGNRISGISGNVTKQTTEITEHIKNLAEHIERLTIVSDHNFSGIEENNLILQELSESSQLSSTKFHEVTNFVENIKDILVQILNYYNNKEQISILSNISSNITKGFESILKPILNFDKVIERSTSSIIEKAKKDSDYFESEINRAKEQIIESTNLSTAFLENAMNDMDNTSRLIDSLVEIKKSVAELTNNFTGSLNLLENKIFDQFNELNENFSSIQETIIDGFNVLNDVPSKIDTSNEYLNSIDNKFKTLNDALSNFSDINSNINTMGETLTNIKKDISSIADQTNFSKINNIEKLIENINGKNEEFLNAYKSREEISILQNIFSAIEGLKTSSKKEVTTEKSEPTPTIESETASLTPLVNYDEDPIGYYKQRIEQGGDINEIIDDIGIPKKGKIGLDVNQLKELLTDFGIDYSSKDNRSALIGKLRGIEIKGRQEGGPIRTGEPYVVGERGPEIIVPSEDGYVLNNSKTEKLLNFGKNIATSPFRDFFEEISSEQNWSRSSKSSSYAPSYSIDSSMSVDSVNNNLQMIHKVLQSINKKFEKLLNIVKRSDITGRLDTTLAASPLGAFDSISTDGSKSDSSGFGFDLKNLGLGAAAVGAGGLAAGLVATSKRIRNALKNKAKFILKRVPLIGAFFALSSGMNAVNADDTFLENVGNFSGAAANDFTLGFSGFMQDFFKKLTNPPSREEREQSAREMGERREDRMRLSEINHQRVRNGMRPLTMDELPSAVPETQIPEIQSPESSTRIVSSEKYKIALDAISKRQKFLNSLLGARSSLNARGREYVSESPNLESAMDVKRSINDLNELRERIKKLQISGSNDNEEKISSLSGEDGKNTTVIYTDNRVTNNNMGGGGQQQSSETSATYSPFNALASRLSTRADRTLAPAGYTARTLA